VKALIRQETARSKFKEREEKRIEKESAGS
jgi:hypothetical protein